MFLQFFLKGENEKIPPSMMTQETDIDFVKQMLTESQFDSIHLNQVPYNPTIDYPALRLKTEIFNANHLHKEISDETSYKNTNNFNSEIIFLPNTEQLKAQEYLKIFDHIQNKDVDFEITESGQLGSDEEHTPYALVSSDYRKIHGYKAGDLIELKMKVSNELVAGIHNFRIAGFVAPEALLHSTIFTDYDYFNKTNKIDFPIDNFNLIFTKGKEKHIDRYAVIDRDRTFANLRPLFAQGGELDLENLNINTFVVANANSLSLKEFDQLSSYHFDFFYFLFVFILLLNIFFVILMLLLICGFLFDSNRRSFINLRVNGFRVRELSGAFIIFLVIQFLLAGLLAFGISHFIFLLFAQELAQSGVSLIIYGASFYLLYMLIALLIFLFLNVAYQLRTFQKQKLSYKIIAA